MIKFIDFFKKIMINSLERRRERYFKQVHLEVYFGVPGSGKTTFAAYFAKQAIKIGVPVYSNVPIKGTFKIDPKHDLGRYLIEECLLIIDEAGLEHSNREFKSFTSENKYFYKMHRHYKAKVIVFSQADDMDIIIRNVAFKFWLVKKSILPFCIVAKGIHKYIGIDNLSHDIKSMYDFDWFIFNKWIIAPFVWPMFDTYDAKKFPKKQFEKW